MNFIYFFFFFSSRRRHTRFDCDWSSDVCSSDLTRAICLPEKEQRCRSVAQPGSALAWGDRKSTRLNSSHSQISYAVFCLKKKKQAKLRIVLDASLKCMPLPRTKPTHAFYLAVAY